MIADPSRRRPSGWKGYWNPLGYLAGTAFALVCVAFSNPAQAIEDGTVFIECPPDTQVECGGDTSPEATGEAIAVDNGGPVTIIYDDSFAPTCGNAGTITRTWTATDESGVSASCTQIIEVVDTTPPEIFCPPDTQVECDEPTDPGTTGIATATDDCGGVATVDYYDDETPGDCPNNYTIRRTWVVRDYCDNESQCEQVIEVMDTTPPVILCPPDATVECGGDTSPASTGEATASDDCSQVSLTYDDSFTPGCGNTGTIRRTWTATDDCGNWATCIQSIMVVDTTRPTLIGCPRDDRYFCIDDVPPPANVTATDNCGPDPTVTFSEFQSKPGSSCNNFIIRTWTAMDDCGNVASCEQFIFVDNFFPPSLFGCPADATYQCIGDVPLPARLFAFDDCDHDLPVTFAESQSNPGSSCDNVITRTWTAENECGRTASCSQIITVDDTTTPVIVCPPDVTIECDQPTDPDATGSATATDNCDPNPSIVYFDLFREGNCPQEYTITRVWQAVDACGNLGQCEQTIKVVDTTPPTLIGCPGGFDYYSCIHYVPSPPKVTATDNCGADPTVTFSQTQSNPGSSCDNTIHRTWTAVDDCGNVAFCEQFIRVNDSSPIILVGCPADATYQCIGDVPRPAYVYVFGSCESVPVTFAESQSNPGSSCNNIITRTWTAVKCGSTASCSQIITVDDTTPPIFDNCPPDMTVECDSIPPPADVTATDNCDPNPTVSLLFTVTPGDCPNARTITRVWTATDACGNSATCTQTIKVVDTTPPTITCPPDATYQCYGDVPPLRVGFAATDNCEGPIGLNVAETQSNPQSSCNNVITRVYTATDECLNRSSCTQVITVNDTIPPVVVWPPDVILTCGDECNLDPSNTGEPIATDNCGAVTTTYADVVTGDCPKRVERTWTVSDGCNAVSDLQIIQCLPKFEVVGTDGDLCTFDMDETTACHDFRILFTQDPKNYPSYKLTATNPGQTFVGVLFIGAPGEKVVITIALPYPFVTKGESPLRAYDWVDMFTIPNADHHVCIVPGDEVYADGQHQVALDDYSPQEMGATADLMVDLTVPDTGVLYLNLHTNYGLKGMGGYFNDGNDNAVDADTQSMILIPNHGDYLFSSTVVDNSIESDEDSLCNINVFKRIPGVGGMAGRPTTTFDGEEDFQPVEGCTVEMTDPQGNVVATGVSDEDGWYMCAYKHTGKPTTFTVTLTPPGGGTPQTQSIQLKANHYEEVNFNLP